MNSNRKKALFSSVGALLIQSPNVTITQHAFELLNIMETLHFKSRAINHLFENAQFSTMILACSELQGSIL